MMKRVYLVILIFAITLFTACQGKKSEEKSGGNPSTSPTSTESTKSSSSDKKEPLPKQVKDIETSAINLIDDLSANSIVKASEELGLIKADFAGVQPSLKLIGVKTDVLDGMTATINDLEKALVDKKMFEAKTYANLLTNFVAEVADSYKTDAPSDLMKIGYMGREIGLNIEKSDWQQAKSNAGKMKDSWDKLKEKLGSNYKKDSDEFEALVKSLESIVETKDANMSVNIVNKMLNYLSTIELDFKKLNATT